MRAPKFLAHAIMVPLLVAVHSAPARAEIRIEGTASNVHVDAQDTTVADVLAALAERFDLRIRGTVGDRHISANFDGPLRRVIARMLDGYDYVISMHGDGLEVMVLGTTSPNAVPPPVYATPTYPAAKLRRDE